MPSKIDVGTSQKTAAITVVSAIFVVMLLLSIRYFRSAEPLPEPVELPTNSGSAEPHYLPIDDNTELLLPVVDLAISNASLESSWASALSSRLNGDTEVVVDGGRVDVVASDYAIEVDRVDKWHEGIGQATHYGTVTERIPVLALIVASDDWPLSGRTRDKLKLIDETCMQQGIKLLLLRRIANP